MCESAKEEGALLPIGACSLSLRRALSCLSPTLTYTYADTVLSSTSINPTMHQSQHGGEHCSNCWGVTGNTRQKRVALFGPLFNMVSAHLVLGV